MRGTLILLFAALHAAPNHRRVWPHQKVGCGRTKMGGVAAPKGGVAIPAAYINGNSGYSSRGGGLRHRGGSAICASTTEVPTEEAPTEVTNLQLRIRFVQGNSRQERGYHKGG